MNLHFEIVPLLARSQHQFAARIITPWWYHVILGLIMAMFVGSQALPAMAAGTLVVLGLVALPALTLTYSRLYGISISQPAGRRSRELLRTTLGLLLFAVAASMTIKLAGLAPLWALVPALLALVPTIVLGRLYDDALRREIARGRFQRLMSVVPSPSFSDIIHSPMRLRICTLMRRTSELEFAVIRDTLELSDANLSKNLKVLTDSGIVAVRKQSSPERKDSRRLTWVALTVDGRKTLEGHLAALAQIADSQPDVVN